MENENAIGLHVRKRLKALTHSRKNILMNEIDTIYVAITIKSFYFVQIFLLFMKKITTTH